MTLPTADELLMGSGSKYFSFLTKGTRITGTILTKPKVQVQTNIKTGEVETFPSGEPKMLLVINVQTDMRESNEDDGTRAIWAKGNMIKAIREAVQAAGASGLDAGGQLTVQYTDDGLATQKNFDPPKLFVARYVPPGDQAVNDLLGLSMPAAAPTPQQTPPPAHQQQPTVAATPTPAPSNGSTPPPPGIDPAVWAAFTPEQRAVFAPAPAAEPPLPPGMNPGLWATLSAEQKALFSDQPPF